MRAARIESYGGPEVLQLVDIDPPSPGPGQVLVEVHGTSLNPVDTAIRSGWMQEYIPLDLPVTLGVDVAGTVVEVGDGVEGLAVGDTVYGIAGVSAGGSGGLADLAVTSPGMLARPPAGLDLATAATLPWVGSSALQAIDDLDVQPGSRVLVHGASGSVGQHAVAIAKNLGAHVVATAHGDGVATASELGADEVVDTDQTDLASLDPFDSTLDLVGQDPSLPVTATKPGGRIVSLLAPADQEAADAKGVSTNLQFTQVTTERLDRLRDLVEQGVLSPRVAQTVDLGDVARGFEVREAGGTYGKVGVTTR